MGEHFRPKPEEAHAWAERGFFVRREAFSEPELDDVRAAVERVAAWAARAAADAGTDYRYDGNRYADAAHSTIQFEHHDGAQTIRVVEPFHHFDPRFDALVDDPRLWGPAQELVGGGSVSLFTDKLNLKRPREGSRFRWHQDSPYWIFDCTHVDRLVNVMLAVDDASVENGCLRIVPGSHRSGLLPGLEGEGELGALFTDPRSFDAAAQVPIEMPAGSLLFFHPHAVHGSEPNLSDLPRRAFLFTYQPAGHRMFKLARERRVAASTD